MQLQIPPPYKMPDSNQRISHWNIVRDRLGSKNLLEIDSGNGSIRSHDSDCDLQGCEHIMELLSDTEVVRRLSISIENKNINTVEEFMNEVISTISEMNSRSDSVKKVKGIIKKTLHCEQKGRHSLRSNTKKNRVHFSEENIYFEIPRPPQSTYKIIEEKCCFYCCFGFLFPNY